jgi:hypothetical protein
MQVKTQTISTDPWKFAAEAIEGVLRVRYIGDEGESRATVKRKATEMLNAKLQAAYATRNGN